MKTGFLFVAAALVLALSGPDSASGQGIRSVRENTDQVRAWNDFADGILRVHRHWLKTRAVETAEHVGGYKRMLDYYREVTVREAGTGRVLSRIRWERENPDTAHMMEVYFYDADGRVRVDYSATFLPGYRNAPYQTLINLHYQDEDLRAFRQFDASGNRIYERCEGEFFDRPVDISLDDGDIPPEPADVPEEVYASCFGFLPLTADRYLKPDSLVPDMEAGAGPGEEPDGGAPTDEALLHRIDALSDKIAAEPGNPRHFVARGRDYFRLQRFDSAIADFTKALELNDNIDSAYFGRGLALGRIGEIDKGIADLTQYIRRHPESSIAYTKRGVRYIWKKDFESARQDLEMAVRLDDANAEAHDDLGVALFQLGRPADALVHFEKAKAAEPSYFKVHHNIAMVHYLTGRPELALPAVDESLRIFPRNRNSLLLKASILDALGHGAAAEAMRERAAAVPAGNWSERSAVR